MRTFIAIKLSTEVHTELEKFQNQLKAVSGKTIRWVNPAIIHLTLKFLGEIDPGRVRVISDALKTCSSQYENFDLEVTGTGVFPGWSRPRVFWAGINGPAALHSLQNSIDRTTAQLGIPSEDRPFSAHLTLGRASDQIPPATLAQIRTAMEKHVTHSFGVVPVSEVVLFQSVLQPGGPVYTPLASHPLKVHG